MANNGKNSVTKAQAEAHRRTLQQLLRTDDNRRCADCLARGPTWASVNLGVFVCLNCSGIHRSLGTDLSKVRSTTLDTWLPEQVAFVQRMGNRRANLYWEGRMPRGFRRPAEGDMLGLRHFINDKYRDQSYALRTWDKPPTIETYLVHPFMKQTEGEGARAPSPAGTDDDATAATAGHELASRSSSSVVSPDPPARRSRLAVASEASGLRPLDPPGGNHQRTPSTGRAPVPPPPRAGSATPVATPELFDLLSLHEPESAPSPSVQDVLLPGTLPSAASSASRPGHHATLSQESVPDAGSSDGGWAAFVGSAAGGAPANASADDAWNAFESSSRSQQDAETAADPFGAQEAAATPALQSAPFQPKFPSAPASPSPQPPSSLEEKPSHRQQKSAEEIMRMFDQPKQQDDLFAAFPPQQSGTGESFPHAWPAFPGLPPGSLGFGDLAVPPGMFEMPHGLPGMPPFPAMPEMHGGWATLPPMGAPEFGGGSAGSGKGMR